VDARRRRRAKWLRIALQHINRNIDANMGVDNKVDALGAHLLNSAVDDVLLELKFGMP